LTVETAALITIIDKRAAAKAGLSVTRTNLNAQGVGGRNALLNSGVAREFSVGTFQTKGEKLFVTDVAFNVLGIDFLSANDAIIDGGSMGLFLRHREGQREPR
jgi:hypothetical protein